MTRLVSIMQPTFLPWVGYFDLIDQSHRFIYLDNVKFSRQSWQQRNRIKTASGLQWVSLTVEASQTQGDDLTKAQIKDTARLRKLLQTIAQSYGKTPCFAAVMPGVTAYLEGLSDGLPLADANIRFIDWACEMLGISTPRIRASDLVEDEDRSRRLVRLCQAAEAEVYLSPAGAADYLQEDASCFAEAGLPIVIQSYAPCEYPQLYPPFQPFASVLDLLMNQEPAQALAVIRQGRRANQPLAAWLAAQEQA